MTENEPFPFPEATQRLQSLLQKGFGLWEDPARIVILRAAATAMQNAFYVRTPDGLDLAPTFQLSFLTEGHSAVSGAVQIVHDPLLRFCEQIAEDLKETDLEFIRMRFEALYTERGAAKKNIARAEEELGRLKAELVQANRAAAELEAKEAKDGQLNRQDPEIHKKCCQSYKRHSLPSDIRALTASLRSQQDQLGEIYSELAGYRIHMGPHIFRYESSWRGLQAACKDSFDGALVDFIFTQTGLDELRTMSPRQLNECARLLHNGTINAHGPFPTRGARAKPSVILVGNRNAVLTTIHRERIKESHLFDEFLFFGEGSSGELPDALARAEILKTEDWAKVSRRLFTYMRGGDTVPSLQLQPEAADLFFGFQKWCEKFQKECPEPLRGYFGHWPHCGVRLALCLAGINWDVSSGSLEPRYLRAAFDLLKRHADRQVALLSATAAAESAEDRLNQQIEEIVVKLRLHGPMTLRGVVRTYSRPSYPVVRQLLLEAVAKKRIEQRGNLFLATDVGVGPSETENAPEKLAGVTT